MIKTYTVFTTCSVIPPPVDIINHINQRIDEFNLPRERTKRGVFTDTGKIEEYKQAYFKFRDYYNNNKNVLDFYTLMFFSFSQQFRFNSKGDFNMPYGTDCFSEANAEYIKCGCEFFTKATISNLDYAELPYEPNAFYYIDSPYLNTTATYNENGGWTSDDDKRLFSFCDDLTLMGIKFAMSNVFSNKNMVNDDLISWVSDNNYNVYSFDRFSYYACGKSGSNTKEVLITNY